MGTRQPRRAGANLTQRRRLATEARRQLNLYTTALAEYIDNPVMAAQALTAATEALVELNRLHEASVPEAKES